MGNAARSSAETALLRVDARTGFVRISVADNSPCCEIFKSSPNSQVSTLSKALVAALSLRWGESFNDGEIREVWSLVAVSDERPARGSATSV